MPIDILSKKKFDFRFNFGISLWKLTWKKNQIEGDSMHIFSFLKNVVVNVCMET